MATKLCGVCDRAIQGRQLEAEGQWFHPDCFACELCEQPLVLGTYSEIDGKRVCQSCRCSDRCTECGFIIATQTSIEVDGRLWHKECFVCFECGEPLKKFIEKQDKIYCLPCVTRKFDGVCYVCSGELGRNFTKACGQTWHDNCFKCSGCGTLFGDNPFVNINGEPWCDDCEPRYAEIKKQKADKANLTKAAALGGPGAGAPAGGAGGASAGRGAPVKAAAKSAAPSASSAKAGAGAGASAGAGRAAPAKAAAKAASAPPAKVAQSKAGVATAPKYVVSGYQKSDKREDEQWNDMDDFEFGDKV